MALDDRTPCVLDVNGPRIATPLEWERALGFRDGWTAITYRGKPAADGPRYKALGNSWAVNCGEWVFDRIRAVESHNMSIATTIPNRPETEHTYG